MPEYTVQLANGQLVKRDLPDDATDAQIRQAFSSDYKQAPRAAVVRNRSPAPAVSAPTISSTDFGWRDNLAQKLSGYAGQVGINERTAYRGVQGALGVLDYLPFVGDAATGADSVQSFKEGSPIKGLAQAGIAAVGVVPGVGDGLAALGKVGLAKLGAGASVGPLMASIRRELPTLPEASTLSFPRTPTSEEMARSASVQEVPMEQVRRGNALQWDRFNSGDHGVPLVDGYADKPLAVRLETGEYILLDGNHRAALAKQSGAGKMQMHVIPAKAYDPANAGRAPVPSSQSDADLLAELFGP